MSDTLEHFILTAPEREVDAWWAEHGMGLERVRTEVMVGGEWDELVYGPDIDTDSHRGAEGQQVPHYTTDRGLRYVIEDRVRELGEPTYGAYCWMIGHGHHDLAALVQAVIEKTNRQVILAAARAMGLEYSDEVEPDLNDPRR